MNKLIKRLAVLSVGLTMAIGAGVAAFGHGKGEVAKAAEGDVLYSADFTSVATHSYTQNKEFTLNGKDWVASVSQVNGGVFYLGCNSTHTAKGVLNNNSEFADVVTAVAGEDEPYSSSKTTAHCYALRFDNAYENVGEVEFAWNGGNNAFQVYLFGDKGDGLELLESTNYATSGASVAGSVTWSTDGAEDFTSFVIAARPGATGSTATNKTLRAANFTIKEGASGPAKTLESITLSGDLTKTDYFKGEAPSSDGLVVTANYDDDSHANVTLSSEITANPATLDSTGSVDVTFTATYKGESDQVVKTVNVTKANPIQALYTKSSGSSVDVYGYYVGFLDGTGPVIMDGAYGIVIYNSSADVSGYTAKETILHVTGSISIYKGLYEIGSATINVASGTFEQPDEPIVHVTNGSETADQASRLTTVTGTAVVTSGSFDSAAGTADIKMNFTVGSKTVQVFYKRAAQTADAEAFAAMKDAVENSTEITIKGFTGWYNSFQVQMNGYVPAAAGYTAEDFAEDLLAQTNAADVCGDYEPDESHYAAIKAKLVAIWSDLAGADKYPSLPSDQKTILAEANADKEGNTVEQAMARYDFLTVKYELSQFINGRLDSSVGNRVEINNNNSLIVVIAVISAVSLVALSTLLVLKKKHK